MRGATRFVTMMTVIATLLPLPSAAAENGGLHGTAVNTNISKLVDSLDILLTTGDVQKAAAAADAILKLSGKPKSLTTLQAGRYLEKIGDAYWRNGEYNKALPPIQQALFIRKKILGVNHTETALNLTLLGFVYGSIGQYQKSVSSHKQSLSIYEIIFGPEDPRILASLDILADAHHELEQFPAENILRDRALAIREKEVASGEKLDTWDKLFSLASGYEHKLDFAKVLPLYEQALLLTEKSYGSESALLPFNLEKVANSLKMLGRYEEALPLLQRSLSICETSFPANDLRTANALQSLAQALGTLNQRNAALPLEVRVLAIREQNFGSTNKAIIGSLEGLANTYMALGRYDDATTLFQRMLAIAELSVNSDDPEIAWHLDAAAVALLEQGKYVIALPLFEKSLKIREAAKGSFGADEMMIANSLQNLAATYSYLANYEIALPLAKRALEVAEANDKWYFDIGKVRFLTILAAIYLDLGEYENALPLLQQVVASNELFLGKDHESTALSLTGLASIYLQLGQRDLAISVNQRALEILERRLGSDHPDTAQVMNNLAVDYVANRENRKALDLLQRAQKVQELRLGSMHPATAISYSNIAVAYGNLGQYDLAQAMANRALEIDELVFGSAHPSTASTWTTLAAIWYESNQLNAAIFAGKQAINIQQSIRAQISKIGTAEVASYSATLHYQYEHLSAWLTEAGRISEAQQVLDMFKETEHFDFIRRASDGDPRKTRIGYTRSEQEWLPRYEQISSHLATLGVEQQVLDKKAKLGLTGVELARQKQLQADLKVAQAAFSAYLDEMRTGFAKKGAARVAEVEESSEQSLKTMQATLKAMDPGAVLVRYYMTDTQVKMLVTTSGVQLARDATIAPKELNSKIAAFNAALRDPKSNPLPLAQELYTALVGPIAQDLQQAGATTVMLYLDGALRYLPFGALHDGKQYVVERWSTPIYTAVAKDKLREGATAQWTAAGMGVTRAWQGSNDPKRGPEFPALLGVKQELAGIVKSASFFKLGVDGSLPGELFLDEAFTAKSLRDVGQRPFSVVHIASHFRFSPGTEINSALLLGDGQELTLGDIRTQGYSFKNVDLLTLSACETGRGGGRDEQGREIEGFGVIAQQQGAKAVLATLWPVADQSTALLMQELYRQRQEKHLTKAEAIRQAQLTVMAQKKYAHPFYWAPFILMGNWL